MEPTNTVELKLYELLKPRFMISCTEEVTGAIFSGKLILSESREAVCHLFDRIRIHYKIYGSGANPETVFVVSAIFESPEIPTLISCFSTAAEASALFDSLKREYCETKQ